VVVPATAPVDRVAEQLSRSQAGQPHALAAQVRLVGVPDLGRQVGDQAAGPGRLGQREVALEAQRSLQRLRPDADLSQEPAPQLALRDRQVLRQQADSRRPPRHQPPHRLGHERVRGWHTRLAAQQVELQQLQRRVRPGSLRQLG